MTPFEEETLKMFDEKFVNRLCTVNVCVEEWKHRLVAGERMVGIYYGPKEIKDFWLTQLRLARADERKKAYEDGKNAAVDYIKNKARAVGAIASINGDIVYEVTSTIFNAARKA